VGLRSRCLNQCLTKWAGWLPTRRVRRIVLTELARSRSISIPRLDV
jgi:hypothetical protein